MSREVVHDGKRALQVRFPFDRTLVERIKTLPNRRWNASERLWQVPADDVVALVDLIREDGFRFDEATRDLYRSAGGTTTLDATPVASPRQSGLFDEARPSAGGDPATGTDSPSEDFTVSSLNERVRAVLNAAFPSTIWIVGEISGFNKNAHRRHVSFELAERDDRGTNVSRVSATLFEATRRTIEKELAAVGAPFALEDEVTVRLRARVELYVPWGSYRVIVDGLDVSYTLGEAARRREEIVRRLIAAGVADRNPSLALSAVPLRVGLITSLGSDAYNDVTRTLRESGYRFDVVVHGARVQGHSTEPSVLNALDRLRAMAADLDVVLIVRGGGSRTDLVWFDSERLGLAVADFPLPVIVGIGHEQDRSVLDAVARSAKTPTAAAAMVVDVVRRSIERLERDLGAVLVRATRAIESEQRVGAERARRLLRAADVLLLREKTLLEHRRNRSVLGARTLVARARVALERWTALIPRAAEVRIEQSRAAIRSTLRSVVQGAQRDVARSREGLARNAAAVGPLCDRAVVLERERTDQRARRLESIDPRRVVERGYAILRARDGASAGKVITDVRDAPIDGIVEAELRLGTLGLRSLGPVGGSSDNEEA